MISRSSTLVLIGAVAVAGGAALSLEGPKAAPVPVAPTPPRSAEDLAEGPHEEGPGMEGDGVGVPSDDLAGSDDDVGRIAWRVPKGWRTVDHPSTVRQATYRLASPSRPDSDVDVSVARAGGTADANAQRWIEQFADRGPDTRTRKSVRGLKVTIVDVSGTYQGGMAAPQDEAHRGWALHGAIVEGEGDAYFFKMVGPAAAVKGATRAFDEMVDSVAPEAPGDGSAAAPSR